MLGEAFSISDILLTMEARFFAVLLIVFSYGSVWPTRCAADEYEDNREGSELSSWMATAQVNLEVLTRLDKTPCSRTHMPGKKYFVHHNL